ncbi:archease [bacterium]|nr:archease [bacterium]
MKREHKFELIEHTADIGVIGYGGSKAEAFENAAFGMFSIMADLDKYEPTDIIEVVATGDDDIALLERFLSSLIVLFDGDGLMPLDFKMIDLSAGKLVCMVSYRKIADDIEWLGPSIKAVTYHRMSVERSEGTWCAQAIFDV